jgi:uncharacterized protein with PhoU and TrkA domain
LSQGDLSREIGSLLRDLKDKAEISVYLAYSGLLYGSVGIAGGALTMEEEVDKLRIRLQELVLERGDELGLRNSLALILLVESLESISDSALRLASIVSREAETHPVLDLAEEEIEEQFLLVEVDEGSFFLPKRIGDLRFQDTMGIRVIAVKRRGRWTFDPDEKFRIEEGDLVLVSGYKAGIETLEEAEKEAEVLEE